LPSNPAEEYIEEIPAAPSNLDAYDATSTSVKLRWKDNSDDERGFHLERIKTEGEEGEYIGASTRSLKRNQTTFIDEHWYGLNQILLIDIELEQLIMLENLLGLMKIL